MKNFSDSHIQAFLTAHLNSNLASLMLKKSPFPEFSMAQLVQQIKGMQVAAKKFPDFLKSGIIFPPHLNLEQTSSQTTAKYKANLVSGATFVDLTCGFGIDAFYISKDFQDVVLVENNANLVQLVENNWNFLNRKATFISEILEQFLRNIDQKFDVIFLDPARRDQQKRKVFLLEDLSPNILDLQNTLLEKAKIVMIKLSPLIDLKYLLSQLKGVLSVHLVAVKNEMKEVLILLSSDNLIQQPKIHCVNLETQELDFVFKTEELDQKLASFSDIKDFLYLPNNAVLKSGAFDLIAMRYGLEKLHPNTQMYTSKQLIFNFPGRIFKVKKIETKDLKKGMQFNIISKNYPLKPEEIKKKYKLKDGGKSFLICTQSMKGKLILTGVEA